MPFNVPTLRRWPTIALVLLGIVVHLARYRTEGLEQQEYGWVRHNRAQNGYDSNNRDDAETHRKTAQFLDLYSSISSLISNPREDMPEEGDEAHRTNHVHGGGHTQTKRFSDATMIPVGTIYDVALNANDTRHFYWRLLKEDQSASGHDSPPSPFDMRTEETDADDDIVGLRCEIHVQSATPFSWVAVGFSERGELKGADLCVLWTDWQGGVHFQSALVEETGRFLEVPADVCRGFRYRRLRGVLKLTFYRSLDPCQPGFQVINRGTSHLVWAYGAGPLNQLTGVMAAGEQTGGAKVQMLRPPVEADLGPHAQLKVTVDRASVPSNETTYWCKVHKLPETFRRKHHVVQYAPAIQSGNEDLVHHMELFHCELPPDQDIPQYQGSCHSPSRPPAIDSCKRVLAAWAMGAHAFTYPQEAGLPIGGPAYNRHVLLELHFNNPTKMAGRTDSSGMTLFYTPHLRPHDASIMELGLQYTDKMAIPPRATSFRLSGHCVPQCTALGLPAAGIYVFGSQLHTHLTGRRVWTKHYRDGRELPELNRDDQYSPHFQEIRRLPRPVHVLPGDSLVTTCEYCSSGRANTTVGGEAITDEMCVNYIHYYPKVQLEVCKSSIDTSTLESYFDFMRKFELQATAVSASPRSNYASIQWTPLRTQFLAGVYDTAPLSMQCNRSTGARFPGFWDGINIPEVTHKLPRPDRKCSTAKNIENIVDSNLTSN